MPPCRCWAARATRCPASAAKYFATATSRVGRQLLGEQPDRLQRRQPDGLGVDEGVGGALPDRLEERDRVAELLAGLGVVGRQLHAASETPTIAEQAAAVASDEQEVERAAVGRADQVVVGDPHSGEREGRLRRVRDCRLRLAADSGRVRATRNIPAPVRPPASRTPARNRRKARPGRRSSHRPAPSPSPSRLGGGAGSEGSPSVSTRRDGDDLRRRRRPPEQLATSGDSRVAAEHDGRGQHRDQRHRSDRAADLLQDLRRLEDAEPEPAGVLGDRTPSSPASARADQSLRSKPGSSLPRSRAAAPGSRVVEEAGRQVADLDLLVGKREVHGESPVKSRRVVGVVGSGLSAWPAACRGRTRR